MPGDAGLHPLVGQHALQALDAGVLAGSRCSAARRRRRSPCRRRACRPWTAAPRAARPDGSASTRVDVWTVTPFCSTQRLIIAPAPWLIIRGTMRSPVSTTVSCTPRAASASMMMQPMKPAPICSTRAPGFASAMIRRASASVQHGCTPLVSMPGIGGRIGVRAGREQQPVERDGGAAVEQHLAAGHVDRLRPPGDELDAQALEVVPVLAQVGARLVDPAHQQVGNRHPRIRRLRLVADQHDGVVRRLLADRLRRDDAGGSVAEDDVSQDGLHRKKRAVRQEPPVRYACRAARRRGPTVRAGSASPASSRPLSSQPRSS